MNNMFFLKSAENFRETLLLGNGRLGAIVYGGVNEDIYKLNDDTLWSGYPRDYTVDGAETVKKVREFILNDEPDKAQPLLEQLYGTYGQCYLPAGTLKIKAEYGEYEDYKRSLSFADAVHTTEFKTACGRYTRKAFASYPDDVICIRYDGDSKLPTMDISLDCELRPEVCFENGTLILEGEAPNNGVPSYLAADERFTYGDRPEEKGMRYAIGLRIRTDGEAIFKNGAICVSDSHYLEIYLTIKTSFAGYNKHPYLEGIDYKSEVIQILDNISEASYDTLLSRHTEDYSSLFGRVEFELEGGRPDLPTDERLKAHKECPDVGLYALMYDFGRYLIISSSRKGTQATNLQGIWNEELAAPWSSSYTVNINTQMNYWGVCGANLAECCEPLHGMIYELCESGKGTAKNLFGAEGFCANHNIDIWRITHPVGNWMQGRSHFSYFPVAGAWLVRHLYDYYLETKDVDFLKGNAFTAILESARFCDSMLTEHDGQLIFAPASSPENRYLKDGQRYAIAKSSAMFQSIVRDALEICIECCHVTGKELEYAEYLEGRLEKIKWLEIGEDGRILEWDGEREEYEPTHRHLSHLYSFYPAKKVNDEKLLEACRRSLEVRGDVSTGWSSVWKMCLWAILGDGDRSLVLADMLLSYLDSDSKSGNGGTYPNLLCACPPAQMDGNFGYVAAVNEMLVQEKDGQVVLLPALPKLWRSGKIKGIRINGKTVDIEWCDGKIVSSRVECEKL